MIGIKLVTWIGFLSKTHVTVEFFSVKIYAIRYKLSTEPAPEQELKLFKVGAGAKKYFRLRNNEYKYLNTGA
jgi:hypothetical protein